MVVTTFLNSDDNFPLGTKMAHYVEILKLKKRILELEQINEDHKQLNGQLRSSVSCDTLYDYDVESFEGACIKEALDIANTLISKQHDYGQDNILVFGEEGIMVRLSDKIHRLINLFKKRNTKPQNESVKDTFTDIAGYAIIGLMLQKDTFQLPMNLDKE